MMKHLKRLNKLIVYGVCLALILFLCKASFGASLYRPKPQPHIKPATVYGKIHPLVEINDVAVKDRMLVVATGTFPAIHVFGDGKYRSWGREGNGPADLKNARAVEISGDTLFVLDFRPGSCKVVSYSLDGAYISSVPVRKQNICYGFKIGGKTKMVEIGQFSSPVRTLSPLNDHASFEMNLHYPASQRLMIHGGPMRSFNVQPPFSPKPAWAVDDQGHLLVWDGHSDWLKIRKNGVFKNYVKVPPNLIKVPADAFDNWLNSGYPTGKALFGHLHFFKNVRSAIRNHLSPPNYYPRLGRILADPQQDIWLLRAWYRNSGERWLYLSHDGNVMQRVDFPPGVSILAVGSRFIVAETKGKNGTEYIALYDRNKFL